MDRNLLLTLRYNGAYFHGSAVQKNAVTVCGTLQPALERIVGEKLLIKCCSRTDAGVHAEMFCLSFHTKSSIEPQRLVLALNNSLPGALAAYACREVPPGFHARYSCLGKRYLYKIHNSPVKNPFLIDLCCHHRYPLDVELLNRACQDFLGRHDFSAFCASGSDVADRVRTITDCSLRREGELVSFEVAGDGFLYNMVRIMVGTLLKMSYGRIAPDAIPEILRARERKNAGPTAPAAGLYLKEVYYDLPDPEN